VACGNKGRRGEVEKWRKKKEEKRGWMNREGESKIKEVEKKKKERKRKREREREREGEKGTKGEGRK
jgi:hypothetical protein